MQKALDFIKKHFLIVAGVVLVLVFLYLRKRVASAAPIDTSVTPTAPTLDTSGAPTTNPSSSPTPNPVGSTGQPLPVRPIPVGGGGGGGSTGGGSTSGTTTTM